MTTYVLMEYVQKNGPIHKPNIKGAYNSEKRALEALERWQLIWYKLNFDPEKADDFIKLQQEKYLGYDENIVIDAYMVRDKENDNDVRAFAFVVKVYNF